jgi:hypothetical protein
VDSERERRIAHALRLAGLLDTALRIPGTRIRFGLDPILGLLPGLGDAVAALIGGRIVWSAIRAGAPRLVVARMLVNVAIDAILGAVPAAGTVFDVAFKAHRRNARLLAEWAATPEAAEARQRRLLLALAVAGGALLLSAAAAFVFGTWALLALLS